jgi:hypothetical protein
MGLDGIPAFPTLSAIRFSLYDPLTVQEPEPCPGEFVGEFQRDNADRLILAGKTFHIERDIISVGHLITPITLLLLRVSKTLTHRVL